MPLTSKGAEILSALTKEYGSAEKAKQVLYAGKNSGKFTGIDDDSAESKLDEIACRADALGARLDAFAEQPAQSVRDYQADDLKKLADALRPKA